MGGPKSPPISFAAHATRIIARMLRDFSYWYCVARQLLADKRVTAALML
jgi:hypothetical protein